MYCTSTKTIRFFYFVTHTPSFADTQQDPLPSLDTHTFVSQHLFFVLSILITSHRSFMFRRRLFVEQPPPPYHSAADFLLKHIQILSPHIAFAPLDFTPWYLHLPPLPCPPPYLPPRPPPCPRRHPLRHQTWACSRASSPFLSPEACRGLLSPS